MNDRRQPDDKALLQCLGEQLERRGVHAGAETLQALLARASAQLRAGADTERLAARLAEQACAAARRVSDAACQPGERLIAVGASTGGPDAIRTFLRGLTRHSPGVVIAQHMPAGFTRLFAERLAQTTGLEVVEAAGNESILPGHVYIAPGCAHLAVRRAGNHFLTRLSDAPPVNDVRPSVDVLFDSVAGCAGDRATGVLLTGMGRDGAQGLLAMRKAGARTFAQNEATCTVYGMPRAAVQIGAAETVLPLERLAAAVLGEEAGAVSPFEASRRSIDAPGSLRAGVPAYGCA